MDGNPLAGAVVTFHPKTKQGFISQGATDKSGKYQMETYTGEGAKTKKGLVPGQYDVTVSCLADAKGQPIPFDPTKSPMDIDPGAREIVPIKYSSVNDMGLTYQVPAGGGKFDIEIQSEEKK